MARAAVSRRRLTHRSASLFDRALDVLVDGVSSPSRGRANYDPYPRFLASGRGSRVIDVDGNEYVDLMLAYGSLIHGHAHPRLVRALTENADRGALLAAASELEVEVAEAIRRMIPGAERVRFTSTGTEAALAALRILRGFTGKKKVLKFEGHYHGWSDAYAVSSNFVPDAVLGHYRNPIPIPDS